MGATTASVTVDGVELAASFRPKRPRELQAAIGFMSSASPADEVVDDE